MSQSTSKPSSSFSLQLYLYKTDGCRRRFRIVRECWTSGRYLLTRLVQTDLSLPLSPGSVFLPTPHENRSLVHKKEVFRVFHICKCIWGHKHFPGRRTHSPMIYSDLKLLLCKINIKFTYKKFSNIMYWSEVLICGWQSDPSAVSFLMPSQVCDSKIAGL